MKKTLWVLFGFSVLAFTYYLFFKPYEFEVRFKAKTLPGDLIGTLRIWNRSLDSANVVAVDSFRSLRQTIVLDDRSYVYEWKFNVVGDSVTHVNVQISEPNRTLINKILIPITEQAIERDASDIISRFYEVLKIHLEITKVKVVGEVELDSVFCVCRSLETRQAEKANGMMKDFSLLTSFISNFNLEPDGLPIVKVLEWNHNLGLLKFDFCFPIKKMDSFPVTESVVFKTIEGGRALKAEYFGNYITSDRAWYELIHYARSRGYIVNGLPIEYFHNNPNLGMNEREWKADVYLPVND